MPDGQRSAHDVSANLLAGAPATTPEPDPDNVPVLRAETQATPANSRRNRDPGVPQLPSSPPSQQHLTVAKEKAAMFLDSVRLAFQVPLASRPATPAPSTATRRSGRLAKQALNIAIRPSKKGEVLAMRKLGIIPADGDIEHARNFDKFIATTMQPAHFEALRDFFPAARELTDNDLLQIAGQAAGA